MSNEQLRDYALQHLQHTTITYQRWLQNVAAGKYPINGPGSEWGLAFADLAQIGDAPMSPPGIFHVSDFGANFNGHDSSAFDNTQAIRDALVAADAYQPAGNPLMHGATVELPPGTGRITGKLTVKNNIWLRGAGPGASILYATGWESNPDPAILVDQTNMAATLSDFSLIMGTTAPTTAHGIHVQSGRPFELSTGGIVTGIERVIVKGVGGDGIRLEGVENRLRDVYVRATTNGFSVLGSDMFLSNCTADTCGRSGYHVHGSNAKLGLCKAFGSGYLGGEPGFNIGTQRNMFAACEAQDNHGTGFNDAAGDNVLSACLADTNGRAGGVQYGFYINGASAVTGCFAINREGTWQSYGYRGAAGGTGALPVIVGCTSRLPGIADVHSSSVGTIQVN